MSASAVERMQALLSSRGVYYPDPEAALKFAFLVDAAGALDGAATQLFTAMRHASLLLDRPATTDMDESPLGVARTWAWHRLGDAQAYALAAQENASLAMRTIATVVVIDAPRDVDDDV